MKMVDGVRVCDDCTESFCSECYDIITRCKRYHQKQKQTSPAVDRFFKFLMGKDRSKLMYLPPDFACKVKHLTNQETKIEDASGKRWSVTLSCVGGSLAFQKGWQRFYLDHGLKEGQVLVFNYTKGSHFTVHIFETTACESINFNNEMPRQSRKRRRDQGLSSEDDLYPAADVNSRVKPISASGNVFQNSKTNIEIQNADFGVPKLLPTSVDIDIEDPVCMINRSDKCQKEEQRDLLNDLSSFEMKNRTSDANKASGHPSLKNVDLTKARELLQSLQQILDPAQTEKHDVNLENASDINISHSCNRVLEPTNPAGDDAMEHTKSTTEDTPQTEQHDVNSENASDTSIPHSCNRVLEPTNPAGDDAMEITKSTVEDTPPTEQHDVNLERVLEPTNPAGDDAMESTGEDAEMAMIDTDPITSNSGGIEDKFAKALNAKAAVSLTAEMAMIDTDPITSKSGGIEDKFAKALNAKAAVSLTAEMAMIDTDPITSKSGGIEDKFAKALNAKAAVSLTAEMAMIDTDPITSKSGGIEDKFAKALNAKTAVSLTDQIRIKRDDTQMTPPTRQAGGHSSDAFTNKSFKKPSDNSEIKKEMLDNVRHFQNVVKPEPFSVSPSVDISKIAEREHAGKSKFGETSISNSAIKNQLGSTGLRVIKEEVEMDDKANVFQQVSRGKEPAVVWNNAQRIPPVVKVEPDLFIYETDPELPDSEVTVPFSAEVKSLLYLELPMMITSGPARRRQKSQTVVYLRVSHITKLWPVLYSEYNGGQAFTTLYWKAFCEENNIKLGDKCTFQVEDYKTSIYKVDVSRGSA